VLEIVANRPNRALQTADCVIRLVVKLSSSGADGVGAERHGGERESDRDQRPGEA